MKILDFYKSVLASVGITDVDGEGMLSAFYHGSYNPVTVTGKRLVMPIPEILRAGLGDNRVAFHPLCEKITRGERGESPVLKLLKDAVGLKVDTVFIALIDVLMHTAASPDTHKKIGPKAAEYLKLLPDANEKSYKSVKKILDACKNSPQYRLVNFYLKHGGEEGASRTCVVSFPIFDELDDASTKEIFGVKIDAKDKARLKALLTYVFTEDYAEVFSYGSNNPEAPYLHALLTSFYKVATQANKLLERHKKHVDDIEPIDISWAECLDTFSLFRGMIPALEGNEGLVGKKDEVVEDRTVRAYARPAVEDADTPPWDDTPAKPVRSGAGEVAEVSSDDPMARFRGSFKREEKRSQEDSWGRTRQTEQRRGFASARYDDERERDDRRPASRGGWSRGGRGPI